jgi:hypothetical protein
MSTFACEVLPDSCPDPQSCFIRKNESGAIVGSYCGCQGLYGYTGFPSCVDRSTSTDLLLSYFVILFVVFLAIFLWSVKMTRARILAVTSGNRFSKVFCNELGFVTVLSQTSLLVLIVGMIFTLVGIANPQRSQSREDGTRQPYLHRPRSFTMAVAEIIILCACILVGGTCKLSY